MSRYGQIVNETKTPQTEKARPNQKKNNAGGYAFTVTPWQQLDRFLILGQIGPTYYATERKVVQKNADVIKQCLAEDGLRVVKRIVEISDSGRAPKNDPAIFALAMAAGLGNAETKKAALQNLREVCRIGTHLFHFAADVQGFRKWGRGLRTAVADWYTSKTEKALAMQALKYQQRDGWAHRDLLRLAHPKAKTPAMEATFRWMVGGAEALAKETKRGKPLQAESLPDLLVGYGNLQCAESEKDVVKLIEEYGLPREAVPTQWLKSPKVWEALLPTMGITALIRNLGKMTSIDMLKPMSATSKQIVAMLDNEDALKKGRVHPMQLLLALGVYKQGHGEKGKLTWTANRDVCEALDSAFYKAFKNVEPTGKNTMIALDVSGSMDGGVIAGAPGITPRIASAAMAMVTARAEQNWHMVGFTSTGHGYGGRWGGSPAGITPIDISKTDRLDRVVQKVSALPMGGTDCALPMLHAAGEELEIDVFQVYTDNETWAGNVHPFQALQAYRAKSGRNAKLVVVGMTATEFTIADPSDAGMLDVVGFDSHAPSLMADFAREGV